MWIYLAGFFDGEGSIAVRTGHVHVSMAQSHKIGLKVLSEIQMFLLTQIRKASITLHKKDDCYSLWVCDRSDVKTLLTRMLPYLRVKKAQAQDVLRYMKMYPKFNTGPFLGMLISESKQRQKLLRLHAQPN
jgi:hypothetical protein